ncbi:MAG: DUF1579 domain-containing protein [Gammaproteobacteria bacterium]|nr:DUF1579 domain-containing protein [Gammaproteobacteria bacterium]
MSTADSLETSIEKGPHTAVHALAGRWRGHTKVWFEPGKIGDESDYEASIKLILGGRFALLEYEGAMLGKPLQGIAIIGYHFDAQAYEMAWIDSAHMGSAIMFASSAAKPAGLSVLGRYGGHDGSPAWGWRTAFERSDENRLIVSAYNVTPDGEESLAVETDYRRSGS